MSAPEVANQCGVHECTRRRWLRQPDFKARVEGAHAELICHTVGRLSASAASGCRL